MNQFNDLCDIAAELHGVSATLQMISTSWLDNNPVSWAPEIVESTLFGIALHVERISIALDDWKLTHEEQS